MNSRCQWHQAKALSGGHFNFNPDEVNCGEVGPLQCLAAQLCKITSSVFREGVYAD